ncbi:MAG: aldo/keto reductase [Bdellovibrionales bacterium]|nr:aldo/keto reductase [Bdellovibrionales bacterium]
MEYRILGKTDLRVSEIGFGAWGIGGSEWQNGNDEEALKALHLAFKQGINFYDTALAYGDGHSEKLIGQLANDIGRYNVIIATKIPPKNLKWPAPCGIPVNDVFPKDHIRDSVHKSLKNLKIDTIDLIQLHVWQDEWLEHTEWQEALLTLKREGKVRFIGVSINDHDPNSALLLAQNHIADTVQCIYNIFDPTADDALLDLCKANQIGVIARVPFDEGALTGTLNAQTTFPEGDFRNLYFGDNRLTMVEQKVNELKKCLGEEAKSLPELAIRFCLSNSAISTVIAGMRKAKHVEANTSYADGKKLSPKLLEKLDAFRWNKNFYASLHTD